MCKEKINEIQECFDKNPISISFDMENVSAALAEIQEKVNALKLEKEISIDVGNALNFAENLIGLFANLVTIGSAISIILPKGIKKSLKELSGNFGEAKKACKDFKAMVGDLSGKFEHLSGMVKSSNSNLGKASPLSMFFCIKKAPNKIV